MRIGKRPKTADRILKAVREARSICVAGHMRPDGDCVGCQLAVGLALRSQGKEAAVWNEDGVPPAMRFLDPEGLMRKPEPGKRFDVVFAVDAASFERLGEAGRCAAERGLLINVDHHASNTRYGDVNWVNPHAPATGELIYRLFRYGRWPITPRIADCLFVAISTDTGSFQYPTTDPASFEIAADLLRRGANLGEVCRRVYHSHPLRRARLLQHLYNSFRLSKDQRIAWAWLTPEVFRKAGADPLDSEDLIDHLRALEPVTVACVFQEMENGRVRVSLRSKDPRVDVGRIAAALGGGGHAAAAGVRLRAAPATAERKVLSAVRQALDLAA